MEKKFTKLQEKIIKSWENVKLVHPSYGEIAKKLSCSPATVFRTVSIYLELNNKSGASDEPESRTTNKTLKKGQGAGKR